ncbi:MAG TPA: hypothetical protein VIT65_17110 [Microlunatus sp.]
MEPVDPVAADDPGAAVAHAVAELAVAAGVAAEPAVAAGAAAARVEVGGVATTGVAITGAATTGAVAETDPLVAVLVETTARPAAVVPADRDAAGPEVLVRVAARRHASHKDGLRAVRPVSSARVIGPAASTGAVRRPPMRACPTVACRTDACPTVEDRTVEDRNVDRRTARSERRPRPVCRSAPTNRDCPPTSTREDFRGG